MQVGLKCTFAGSAFVSEAGVTVAKRCMDQLPVISYWTYPSAVYLKLCGSLWVVLMIFVEPRPRCIVQVVGQRNEHYMQQLLG